MDIIEIQVLVLDTEQEALVMCKMEVKVGISPAMAAVVEEEAVVLLVVTVVALVKTIAVVELLDLVAQVPKIHHMLQDRVMVG